MPLMYSCGCSITSDDAPLRSTAESKSCGKCEREVVPVSWWTEEIEWPDNSIHLAAFRDDSDKIWRLIALGADPAQGDARGITPLHVAAREHSINAVRVLLEVGVSVDP